MLDPRFSRIPARLVRNPEYHRYSDTPPLHRRRAPMQEEVQEFLQEMTLEGGLQTMVLVRAEVTAIIMVLKVEVGQEL